MAGKHPNQFKRTRRRNQPQRIRVTSPTGETTYATLGPGGREILVDLPPGWVASLDRGEETGKNSESAA